MIGSGTGATRFAQEFIGAINHINYNQDNGLNAFAGKSHWGSPACMLLTLNSRSF